MPFIGLASASAKHSDSAHPAPANVPNSAPHISAVLAGYAAVKNGCVLTMPPCSSAAPLSRTKKKEITRSSQTAGCFHHDLVTVRNSVQETATATSPHARYGRSYPRVVETRNTIQMQEANRNARIPIHSPERPASRPVRGSFRSAGSTAGLIGSDLLREARARPRMEKRRNGRAG